MEIILFKIHINEYIFIHAFNANIKYILDVYKGFLYFY